ncbi:MAG: hypothetical protein KDE35_10340 [Geminicoccaceae bacterium]|nr:hypothetical protein [Geminicoccaceae bacterium]
MLVRDDLRKMEEFRRMKARRLAAHAPHDHEALSVEVRRRQAKTIAKGVHRALTSAGNVARRLLGKKETSCVRRDGALAA